MERASTLSARTRRTSGLRLHLRSAFGVVDEAKGRWRHRRLIWSVAGALLTLVLVGCFVGALQANSGGATGTIRGTVVTYSRGTTFPPANSTLNLEQRDRVVGRLHLGTRGGFTFIEHSGTYVLALSGYFCTGKRIVVRSGESTRMWVHCALPVAAPVLKPTKSTANVAQPPTSSATQPFTPTR
jgi:hypothetical protein